MNGARFVKKREYGLVAFLGVAVLCWGGSACSKQPAPPPVAENRNSELEAENQQLKTQLAAAQQKAREESPEARAQRIAALSHEAHDVAAQVLASVGLEHDDYWYTFYMGGAVTDMSGPPRNFTFYNRGFVLAVQGIKQEVLLLLVSQSDEDDGVEWKGMVRHTSQQCRFIDHGIDVPTKTDMAGCLDFRLYKRQGKWFHSLTFCEKPNMRFSE
jgi:hypothetical protein